MMLAQKCRWGFASLALLVAMYSGGCSSGWEGTTAHVQESEDFTGKGKGDVIQLLGIPSSVFSKEPNSGTEYWLYRSQRFYYVLLLGKTKVHGYVVKFTGNIVDSTYSVDNGMMEEIATRGWDYLELLSK